MAAPVLDQLNLISADFDATMAFYRILGVEMQAPARTPGGEPFHASHRPAQGAALELDSPRFARLWNEGWAEEAQLAGRILLGLRVADRQAVDRLYAAAMEAGHRSLQPPADGFWGARYAIVEDPDGRAVGLMSAVEDRYRRPPPL
ncbi:MAG: VOC family protein [Allosphingosinicella sp.]